MRPLYHEITNQIEVFTKQNNLLPPHLHQYLEYIYVTEGRLLLGIGDCRFEMGPRDLAVIFPNVIHQFDVDDCSPSQAIYALGTPSLTDSFHGILQKYCPRTPIIPGEIVHPDIPYALNALLTSRQNPFPSELQQAYFQILLARTLPFCHLTERKDPEFSDLIWKMVSYISRHFTEDLTLSGMARQLGVSPYRLSRLFSGILHMNFNQYLNEIRLDYASQLLRTTDLSVTDIFNASGFGSQTTFNRAFLAKYRLSPREYRHQNQQPGKAVPPLNPFSSLSSDRDEKESTDVPESFPWKLATGRFLL